jgi:kynureninase
MNLHDIQQLDLADPLRSLRSQFTIPPEVIYLDGNSLGAMPTAVSATLKDVVEQEWGVGLIRSWNTADWMRLPNRVGNKIARLIGAKDNEVMAVDSTSVNLYKALNVAATLQKGSGKTVLLTERDNFPTDIYIAEQIAQQFGLRVEMVEGDIAAAITGDTAILLLTQVNYRTGTLHDMTALTATAHAQGALTVWDLAHSAGALPVDVHAANADFVLGCGYKYLNGGPGAPSFIWVNPRLVNTCAQPLVGWLGHTAPFAFTTDYVPAQGIQRYMAGSPTIFSLAALQCGVDTLLAAEPLGGMQAIRRKSLALTNLFMRLIDEAKLPLTCITPRDESIRGSQVSYTHPTHAYAMVQALIARGVIGDFRAPDILRFGFTPAYTSYHDVWQSVQHLIAVIEKEEYLNPAFMTKNAIT